MFNAHCDPLQPQNQSSDVKFSKLINIHPKPRPLHIHIPRIILRINHLARVGRAQGVRHLLGIREPVLLDEEPRVVGGVPRGSVEVDPVAAGGVGHGFVGRASKESRFRSDLD